MGEAVSMILFRTIPPGYEQVLSSSVYSAEQVILKGKNNALASREARLVGSEGVGSVSDCTCEHCRKIFSSPSNKKSHVLLWCPKAPEEVLEKREEFICEYCGKSFGTLGIMKKHIAEACPKAQEEVLEKREEFICEYCEASFSLADSLKQHISKSCPKAPGKKDRPKPKRCTCEHYGNTFTRADSLKRHISEICRVALAKQKGCEDQGVPQFCYTVSSSVELLTKPSY